MWGWASLAAMRASRRKPFPALRRGERARGENLYGDEPLERPLAREVDSAHGPATEEAQHVVLAAQRIAERLTQEIVHGSSRHQMMVSSATRGVHDRIPPLASQRCAGKQLMASLGMTPRRRLGIRRRDARSLGRHVVIELFIDLRAYRANPVLELLDHHGDTASVRHSLGESRPHALEKADEMRAAAG